jgi:predicted nucleic acid-binding protein
VGENQLLVDTDILIAYLNRRAYRNYLEAAPTKIYYSAVTKKELLSKRGLKASERRAILTVLRRYRLVRIDQRIAEEFSRLRSLHPRLERGDSLIAATALAKRLPLLTQNQRHFRVVKGVVLLPLQR